MRTILVGEIKGEMKVRRCAVKNFDCMQPETEKANKPHRGSEFFEMIKASFGMRSLIFGHAGSLCVAITPDKWKKLIKDIAKMAV